MPTIPDGKYHIVRQLDGWTYCTDSAGHISFHDNAGNFRGRVGSLPNDRPAHIKARESAVRQWIADRAKRMAKWDRTHAPRPTTSTDRRIAKIFGAGADATPSIF